MPLSDIGNQNFVNKADVERKATQFLTLKIDQLD